MTYDEASMQSNRHFYMSLQELKNLRPQLYSAAEYCESSYIFNDQKQVVLDNLKDYSIKAIVNAVDHLGTVAYKLNEVLSQETSEISSAEIRVAALAQRIRLCQEHIRLESLDKQRLNQSNRRYHRHYVLPDAVPNFKDEKHQENTSEKNEVSSHESESEEPQRVRNSSRTLSWHLAADPFTATKGSPGLQQGTNRLHSSAGVAKSPIPEHEVLAQPTERGSSASLLPARHGLGQKNAEKA